MDNQISVTTLALSPRYRQIIERIQRHHEEDGHGKWTLRAAIGWALDLADEKLDREERKAKSTEAAK